MLPLLEHIHGHLGWLAALVLVHPAVVLRRRGRRAHLAVIFAVALPTIAASFGAFLYPSYRELLKGWIFRHHENVGLMFERKEHLAFAAVMFAWLGAAAYVAAWKTEGTDRTFRTLAHRAYVIAAGIAIAVAALGTAVGTYKTF